MNTGRTFFGLTRDPFPNDLPIDSILKTPEMSAVLDRFQYALDNAGVAVITGDIGSGKSTSIRYALAKLHPSMYCSFYVTASTGSILELYKQIATVMHISGITNSKAIMTATIRNEILTLGSKKLIPILVIDEASLLRLDVLSELHTLLQFEHGAGGRLPLILIGQASLIDKLTFRTSAPLASRVITRCHLTGLDIEGMRNYLQHHLRLCGIEHNLFDDPAQTAIHQGSGGLLRKANHLARGALIAAAMQKSRIIGADHVRIASTELI
jgi:type II secretory pathway predicted ATPase ExeA